MFWIVHTKKISNVCIDEQIYKFRDKRLKEPTNSATRMARDLNKFPYLIDMHGYCKDCYHTFTVKLERLSFLLRKIRQIMRICKDSHVTLVWFTNYRCYDYRKRLIIFFHSAFFLEKVEGGNVESTSKLQYDGVSSFIRLLRKQKDKKLLTRIRNVGIFACEAKYHTSCGKNYTRNQARWRISSDIHKKE